MNILVFGDSITQGFLDDESGGWVARLFTFCLSEMEQSEYKKYFSVFNLGISGQRSCDLLQRFSAEFDVRREEGMVTVFSIGINDSARHTVNGTNWCALDDYTSHMQQMIEKAKKSGQVVLVGLTACDEEKLVPIPWFPEYSHYQSDRDMYDNVLKDLAMKNDCLYIPTEDLFNERKSELLPDGLHPNAEGHQLIYERVMRTFANEGILY